jgi:hypothetical protein|tara:strand:+ start:409 stop:636 length:228 start_codon:yes stop_codon:yes gene_type:complete
VLSLIAAILKAFPVLADLFGNAVDMLREQQAQQRRSTKDTSVDASVDEWLRKREAGKQRAADEASGVSGGSSSGP